MCIVLLLLSLSLPLPSGVPSAEFRNAIRNGLKFECYCQHWELSVAVPQNGLLSTRNAAKQTHQTDSLEMDVGHFCWPHLIWSPISRWTPEERMNGEMNG